MARKRVAKKPSKLEAHADATAKSYSHSSSSEIERQQSLLEYTITLHDARITELLMLLADAKAERAQNEATLKGLRQVTSGR